MKNDLLSSMDSDGLYPNIFSLEPLVFHRFGSNLYSQLHSFVDNSMYHWRNLYAPGSLALPEAFKHMSKFAGAVLFWFCSTSSSNVAQDIAGSSHGPPFGSATVSMQVKPISSIRYNLSGFDFSCRSKKKSTALVSLSKISNFMMRLLWREAKRVHSYPVLTLAAALVPPIQKLSSKGLGGPMENTDLQMPMSQMPHVVECEGCGRLPFPEVNWTKHTVEPRTDVHPYSVCEKLGPKYASIPAAELNNRSDFYQDLLSAFEKSLRARLIKTNPATDFDCLSTFGSYFRQDIPLPLGTVIDFRRTADGHLITEIGGNQIGSVHSKDLCRAFFDMYIGDVPVCEQAKEEIGRNVANIVRRC